MAYLEKLLPEFRNGAKIKRECWSLIKFVHIKNGKIVDEDGNHIDFSDEAFISNDWELYQERVDWDCVIKNKCLCWFWDGDGSRTINELKCVGEGEFYDDCCRTWENCRPVNKDEVTFYEDVEK